MNIYTIRDNAAEYFLPIFMAKTHMQAKRMFIGSLGPSFAHRADFFLYQVGTFDDTNGTIEACDPASVLAGLSIPDSMDPNTPTLPLDPELEPLKGVGVHNSQGTPS